MTKKQIKFEMDKLEVELNATREAYDTCFCKELRTVINARSIIIVEMLSIYEKALEQ